MLDLSRSLIDTVDIKGTKYNLNLSFDNVLKLFEMFSDDNISSNAKPFLALRMLTGNDFLNELSVQEAILIYSKILEEHIKIKNLSDEIPKYDLLGNPLPVKPTKKEEKRVYSLKYDSDYIFASFLQAYGIDLFEVQGKLHWKKFNALLTSLPEGTKFVEVTKIRSWKPSKHEDTKYKEHMKKLQREYELPEE